MLSSGKAYCWGDNSNGELGNNSTASSSVAVAVTTSGVLSGKTLVQITAGNNYTCALDSAGLAYCWGLNSSGQLGNNSTTSSSVPVAVSTSGVLAGKTLTQIAVGQASACALDSAGLAYCWGDDTVGELGNSSIINSSVPVAVSTSGVLSGKTLTQITAGGVSACALANTGLAYCWGSDSNGQLGNNLTVNSSVPVAVVTSGVLSGKTLVQITEGSASTCALDSAGLAYCWGSNGNGQLGNNSTTQSTVPVAVVKTGALSGKILTQISGGRAFTCALDSAGLAYCWGSNGNGQLGINSTTQSQVPVAVVASGVLSGKILTQISAGGGASSPGQACGLDSSGIAYCWGFNVSGELGNNSTTQSLVAVFVAPQGPTAVAAFPGDALATVYWTAPAFVNSGTITGYTASASPGGASCTTTATTCTITGLTNGTAYTITVMVTVSTGTMAGAPATVTPWPGATTLSAGFSHSCQIRVGKAYCWGDNSQGELGINTTAGSDVPVAVYTGGALAGVTLTQIAAGQSFTCALSSAGAAFCWGLGTSGQLGNNLGASSTVPVAVTTSGVLSGRTLTQITAGLASACALDSAGLAYCWGLGTSGQLGNNLGASSNVPVAVTTSGVLAGLTLTQISGGATFACAQSGAGDDYCWGSNASGQLGNNSTTQSLVPVAVTTSGALAGLTLTQISAGTGFACALSSEKAAYCWGLNSSGQLGNPATAVNFLVPTAVTAQAQMISAGSGHACLIRNGRAFCWGLNANGQLGNNSTTQSLVPVAVSTSGVLSGVTLTQIAAGTGFTCALSSAGAAYCWGLNASGQLGNNSTTQSLVPVGVSTSGALSGVTLTQITVGASFACALSSAGVDYCWGLGTSGQLGNGATTSSLVPVALPNGGVAGIMISDGSAHGCALTSGNDAACWGLGTSGQLGDGSVTSSSSPVLVTTSGVLAGVSLIQIDDGNADTCAAGTGGAAYCWGIDTNGQLGNNSTTQATVPVAVTTSGVLSGVTLSQISPGGDSTCALSSAGIAYCWGLGTSGELGNNSTTQSLVPVTVITSGVLSGAALAQVSVGQDFACALDTAGAAYCWGLNANGQLGNNSTTQSAVPVLVHGITPGPPTGVTAVPGDTTATISWTAPASFGTGTLTGYKATATAASGSFSCSVSGATTCVISGLTNGTTYTVTVITRTTDGDSAPSSPVTVTPAGVLSLTLPSSLTWAVTGNGLNRSVVDTVPADQQFTVADNTGTGAGWHVTVSATTFTSGSKTLPNTGAADFTGNAASLTSATPSATCVASCTLPADTTAYPVVITTAASSPPVFTIYDTSAATGLGSMIIGGSAAAHPVGWWLQVPATVLAGTYTSTLTLTVVSGP